MFYNLGKDISYIVQSIDWTKERKDRMQNITIEEDAQHMYYCTGSDKNKQYSVSNNIDLLSASFNPQR